MKPIKIKNHRIFQLKTKITYLQYGGKSTIAKWIVSHFPEHKIYFEPFCGSCSVLFEKEKSFIEIINDLDGRIINMFNKIREEPEKLAALLWATPYSKSNWRDIKPEENSLEDARLLMAERQFYCGNGNTSTWAIDKSGNPHKPKPEVWSDWFLRILPAANRLRTVQILQEDAITAIERVADKEDTLIYVDPPYTGHENEYRFSVDYQKLVDTLKNVKAKVVVSEYPEAEKFWNNWNRKDKTTTGSARTGRHNMKAKLKTEVLFFNF